MPSGYPFDLFGPIRLCDAPGVGFKIVRMRPSEWGWPARRRYPYDWAVQGV